MQQHVRQSGVWALGGAVVLATSLLGGCRPNISNDTLVFVDADRVALLLEKWADQTLIIDARSPRDFVNGVIDDAINVQLNDVPADQVKDRFAGHTYIVVYGQNAGSPRAEALSKRLLAGGLGNVETYLDGYENWLELGHETFPPDTP